MERGVKKRTGRFIKNTSGLLESIQLSAFSFDEICSRQVMSTDNSRCNLVRARLHHPDAINTGVLGHAGMSEELIPASQRPPLIQPVDFTAEWEKFRRRSNRRASGEDDDFDLEDDGGTLKAGAESKSKAAAPALASNSVAEPVAEAQEVFREEQARVAADQIFKSFSDPVPGSVTPVPLERLAVAPPSPSQPPPIAQAPEFIPMPTAREMPAEEPRVPEREAVEAYRQQLKAKMDEEGITKTLQEEAKALGYDDGFRLGEEKGELQMRQQTAAMFDKVSEVFAELDNLKVQVLEAAQENFDEIARAVSEAVLRREIDLKPELLAEVVQRAIRENVEGDQFKVAAHPNTIKRLSSLVGKEIENRLMADESLPEGDFRLDSQIKSVHGSFREMVSEALKQMDTRLFESKKAG
jgi:flagellar biosynthesis/type III secretory pathway protein FliH